MTWRGAVGLLLLAAVPLLVPAAEAEILCSSDYCRAPQGWTRQFDRFGAGAQRQFRSKWRQMMLEGCNLGVDRMALSNPFYPICL